MTSLYILAPQNNSEVSEIHLLFIPSLEMKCMRSEGSVASLQVAYPPGSGRAA